MNHYATPFWIIEYLFGTSSTCETYEER